MIDINVEMDSLRKKLAGTPTGRIAETNEITRLLGRCWQELECPHDMIMCSYVVYRMEDAWWDPPLLSFLVPRYRSPITRNTMPEMQEWTVNLDAATATMMGSDRRLL